METFFAPAGRAKPEELKEQVDRSVNDPVLQVLLEAVSGFVLILNRQRQILAANQELLDFLGLEVMDPLIGHRPGEGVSCEHCQEGPDGCGTGKKCRACGAVLSILAAQETDQPADGECSLTSISNGKRVAHEFRVRVTPLQLGGEQVTVFLLRDISAEKRKVVLEGLFLHDMRNTLFGLNGWATQIQGKNPLKAAQMILSVAKRLSRQVEDHYLIAQAEQGELSPQMVEVPVENLLSELNAIGGSQASMMERLLEIAPPSKAARIKTDPVLLGRILLNMVRNGLEAANPGETVRVWMEIQGGKPVFLVHNPGFIREYIALRVFQRSFTTKGTEGRGLGTYIMKLFGEQALGGKVGFTSTREEGTTFFISLPLDTLVDVTPDAP